MALSPREFEKLIATLFKAYGHQAQVLGGSADYGVDILVLSCPAMFWISH
jgi:HJR/Mrr/RecB family endonuclease